MRISIFISLILVMAGCAPRYQEGYRETGMASWYGPGFHGKKTSSGETYDMHGQTAAHRTLPFGTRLRVTDIETGRDVEVRVNDRGPFVGGRILDLSQGAAQELGIVGKGVARIRIEIVELGLTEDQGVFWIQVGSFSVFENAQEIKERLEKEDQKVYISSIEADGDLFHRVRVGPFDSRKQAESVRRRLIRRRNSLGTFDLVVVRANS
jgi:rare lipoprotein A